MKRDQVLILLVALFIGGYIAGRATYKGHSSAPVTAAAPAAPVAVAAAPEAAAPTPAPSAPTSAPTSAPAPSPAPAAAPSAPADPNQIWKVAIHDDDAKKGPDSALVKVVMFGAFGNQESVEFLPSTIAEIEKTFGNKVQIRFKHKVIPLPHPDSLVVSEIAAAANAQGKFWPVFDKLMKNTGISRSAAEDAAKEAGCDMARLRKEVDAGKHRTVPMRDSLVANEVAANTYPNVMVNGVRLNTPKTWERLKPIIEEQLKKAEDLAKGGKKPAEIYADQIKGGKIFDQMAGPQQTFDISGSPILGNPKAKIEVAVFEDFQCPFCAKIAPSVKEFQKRFPNDVKIVYKHMPLDIHDNAQIAAEASMAALAQGKFWEYHDVLFNNQSALGKDQLEQYAQQIGLDMARFKSDMASGVGKSVIQRDMQEGGKAGVSGTPSVYINGMKYQGPRGYPPEGLEAVARTYFGL